MASPGDLPTAVEDHLVQVYFNMANTQWPFLLRSTFDCWLASWRSRPQEGPFGEKWCGFFVNMVTQPSHLELQSDRAELIGREDFCRELSARSQVCGGRVTHVTGQDRTQQRRATTDGSRFSMIERYGGIYRLSWRMKITCFMRRLI
jgi:hypothetical protein